MGGNPSSSPPEHQDPFPLGDRFAGAPGRSEYWSRHPLGPPEQWPPILRTLLATVLPSPQPMWIGWGPRSHLFYNDACVPLLGAKADSAWGEPAAEIWAEIWPILGPPLETVRQTGTPTRLDHLRGPVEREGGPPEVYQALALSPIRDGTGAIVGVLGIASENPHRALAEGFASALQESKERLSASLTAAGTGTFRWDLRQDRLDFDASLARLFGLPGIHGPSAMGELVLLVHPDDRPRVEAASRRILEAGDNLDVEFRVIQPSGAIRWLEGKGRTFFGESGSVAYMTGACVDITKRKQAEMFVWRQRDVLEQIVQGAPLTDVLETLTLDLEQVAERSLFAMVMRVDRGGTRLHCAAGRRCPPAWRERFDGVEIGFASGSCGAAAARREPVIVRDVMTSPYWSRHRTDAVRLGLRACWSTPILSSRGAVLGTLAVYAPDPSAPTETEIRFVDIVTRTAAIAVERDLSEATLRETQAQLAEHAQRLEERVQERTARLQETIAELESFSYSISHDMRAPLRAMQSFAQILAEDCGDRIGPEGKDYIRRIIGASDRMDRLIQDVLTYSRVTRTEVDLVPVDVEGLLNGIRETYPLFQPPQARIEIRRPLARVMGNEASLTQCLANLIGNAIKFVAPGVTPHVEVWSEVHGERVRLHVRDNGIGIEPDAHEKIFHIFYQMDRSYPGTGIGLAVVRKAAERMGGTIGLDSTPGQGSTFHLELALAR